MPILLLGTLLFLMAQADEPGATLPTIDVTQDNTVVAHSCRIRIPPDTIISDADGDGVLHVTADDVVLEFAPGSILRGAARDKDQDKLTGLGIRVRNHRGVTIRNATITGYRVGLHATETPRLVLEDCRFAANYAPRLRSTPAAEDTADWMWPHRNDDNQWLKDYGAAAYIEDSEGITVRRVSVRRGQNGILLDRVFDSRIYDNDCSFLSGWGIGLWRSSRNVISRNAFDFCIRGYSHDVYHRGQDSCGLMLFEQCNDNVIVENSMTRCGDGVFAFAGQDALGEGWFNEQRTLLRQKTKRANVDDAIVVPPEQVEFRRGLGCNRNLFVDNDCSFNAIHGIEMTFSFDNVFLGNRFAGNRIDGIWAGYCRESLISGNYFDSNGVKAPRLDGGGIIIERGVANRIRANTFVNNSAAVMLWAEDPCKYERLPWGRANGEADERGMWRLPSARNVVSENRFEGDAVALHVRNSMSTTWFGNDLKDVGVEIDSPPGTEVHTHKPRLHAERDYNVEAIGDTRPIGKRSSIAGGRAAMIMTEWGPWDFNAPMIRKSGASPGRHTYEVFGTSDQVEAQVLTGDGEVSITQRDAGAPAHVSSLVVVSCQAPGVHPYRMRISSGGFASEVSGTLVRAEWTVRVFLSTVDPMQDPERWRALADGDAAFSVRLPSLDLALGYRGPSALGLSPEIAQAQLPGTHYGLTARAKVRLAKGRWLIRTRSDDGLRVLVNGRPMIERWDIHVPTVDTAIVDCALDEDVEFEVEYFQATGFAVLALDIEPARE